MEILLLAAVILLPVGLLVLHLALHAQAKEKGRKEMHDHVCDLLASNKILDRIMIENMRKQGFKRALAKGGSQWDY